MLIFSVSFQTLTETSKVKEETKIQRCSEPSDAHACSPDSNAVDQTAEITKDTRVSEGSRRMKTVTQKTGVLVKTVNHVKRSSHPSQT